MGSFANSMFSVLLGWFRDAIDWAWNVMYNAEDGGLIGWIGKNWLGLIIALSLICMAVDAIVHLLRWRSYKVWISFFRRLRGKEEPMEDTSDFSPAPSIDPDNTIVSGIMPMAPPVPRRLTWNRPRRSGILRRFRRSG